MPSTSSSARRSDTAEVNTALRLSLATESNRPGANAEPLSLATESATPEANTALLLSLLTYQAKFCPIPEA